MSRQSVGCAVYDFESAKLMLLEDCPFQQNSVSCMDDCDNSDDVLEDDYVHDKKDGQSTGVITMSE